MGPAENQTSERDRMMEDSLRRIEDRIGDVLGKAERHEKWLESIDARFRTLNGTVASLKEDSIECRVFRGQHKDTVDEVQLLRDELAEDRRARDAQFAAVRADLVQHRVAQDTTKQVDDKWKQSLRPWIEKLVLVAIALALYNGKDILKLAGKIVGVTP